VDDEHQSEGEAVGEQPVKDDSDEYHTAKDEGSPDVQADAEIAEPVDPSEDQEQEEVKEF